MESVLGIIFSAENVRMLVLLVFGFSYFSRLKNRIEALTLQLNGRIDALALQVNGRIDSLALQVNNRMDALTFVLEKNGSLRKEDKEYIDSRINVQ